MKKIISVGCFFNPGRPRTPMLVLAILLLCLFLPACEKQAPSSAVNHTDKEAAQPEPALPPGFEKMSPAGQAAWLENEKLRPAREAKAARDRAELVRPAPTDFRPEPADRKIRLHLIAQKKMMRAGETFWYRLELQNVGRKPIYWHEQTSFFKRGELGYGQDFNFFVRQPDGKEWEVRPPLLLPLLGRHRKDFAFPPGTSEAEQARLFDCMVETGNRNELSITLFPGETLVTRPWIMRDSKEATAIWARCEDPDAAIPGQYRELPTSLRFDQIGTYRIRVVYDDRPSPLIEAHIQSLEKYGIRRKEQIQDHKRWAKEALGPVQSNSVSLEVTP